jgi:hypothetical protein
MRLKEIFCAGRILLILTLINLFLITGIAQSQCVPGSKSSTYGGHEGYWLSSGTGKVPFELWPPSLQQHHPNQTYANAWLWPDWLACTWADYTGEYVWWPCEVVYQCAPDPCLSMGTEYTWTCKLYCYSDFDQDPGATRDYDCDGRFDNDDPNPGTTDPKINAEKGFPGCNASTGSK